MKIYEFTTIRQREYRCLSGEDGYQMKEIIAFSGYYSKTVDPSVHPIPEKNLFHLKFVQIIYYTTVSGGALLKFMKLIFN